MLPAALQLSVRERLLNAAERVVARDGVSKLTLEAVAREAGVSKGGLLYHFHSKSALVTAVVERMGARCQADQIRAMAEDKGKPGAFTRAYLSARAEPPKPEEEPVVTALLAAAGTDPQYLEPIRQRITEWQARLESDGIDPATATIVRLAIDGLCLTRLLRLPVPQDALCEQVMKKLVAMTEPDENGARPARRRKATVGKQS
jgi:AcrR family transcriptional regulator